MRDLTITVLTAALVFGTIAGFGIIENSYYDRDTEIFDEDMLVASEPIPSLELDVIGYVEAVRPYYMENGFNISRQRKYQTVEETKKYGGVCKHYTQWYIELARADGHFAQKSRSMGVENGRQTGHDLAKIWNKEVTEICYINYLDYWCVRIG